MIERVCVLLSLSLLTACATYTGRGIPAPVEERGSNGAIVTPAPSTTGSSTRAAEDAGSTLRPAMPIDETPVTRAPATVIPAPAEPATPAPATASSTLMAGVDTAIAEGDLERAAALNASYHVLGGVLSPLDGVGPDDLSIARLVSRVAAGGVVEIILAVNATVEGQTTAHYITDQLDGMDVKVSRLAHGVPVGGELDYLDEGTLAAAMKSRTAF